MQTKLWIIYVLTWALTGSIASNARYGNWVLVWGLTIVVYFCGWVLGKYNEEEK